MMTIHTSEDQGLIWTAIVARNRDWDGRVYFAVRTTGIYCLPSCPSRRPKYSSVEFFSSVDDAERAGYRPCKRCRPEQWERDAAEFRRLMEILHDQQEAVSSVEEWAAAAGTPPALLFKQIKRFTDTTPKRLIMEKRNKDLKDLLKKGKTISSSQFDAGYGSSSRLYEKAVNRIGMTPHKYQNGGAGERIVYSFMDTPLGRMLMAATEHGVCSLKFGEKDHALLKELGCEFPTAEIEQQTGELDLWMEQLNAYFSIHQRIFEIPVDFHATAFQLLVWQELRKIPYGEKRSYSEIAKSIGKPKAVRAVASACAANPVAIINPCHRVVHSDGSVSGYRWGIERKNALLKMEREESKDQDF